jgi:C-terminal processing protease CtpA/Prc
VRTEPHSPRRRASDRATAPPLAFDISSRSLPSALDTMHTSRFQMEPTSVPRLVGALALLFCASCAAAQTSAPFTGAPAAEPQSQRAYIGANFSFGGTARIGGPVIAEYPTIVSVDRGSPAARAGLVAGDVILEVEGQDARKEGVRATRLGKYTLRIRRGDTEQEVVVVGIPAPTRASRARP